MCVQAARIAELPRARPCDDFFHLMHKDATLEGFDGTMPRQAIVTHDSGTHAAAVGSTTAESGNND